MHEGAKEWVLFSIQKKQHKHDDKLQTFYIYVFSNSLQMIIKIYDATATLWFQNLEDIIETYKSRIVCIGIQCVFVHKVKEILDKPCKMYAYFCI